MTKIYSRTAADVEAEKNCDKYWQGMEKIEDVSPSWSWYFAAGNPDRIDLDEARRLYPLPTFVDYQSIASRTAVYPTEQALEYLTLGLASEAGEVAGKVKKIIRGDNPQADTTDALAAELGDVLWYLSELATHLNLDLDDIATGNLDKLAGRANTGKLKGDGDTR